MTETVGRWYISTSSSIDFIERQSKETIKRKK